ncbi:MAG: glutamate--tRNA ligase [Candidatus Omnitrophota bacterium]|nr:MAG: glutamate--tRNA ligase [Candidatus Omnitrophota bacterium]
MADKEIVRARFAPSPTGYLHIGGVRTALFNWLFTRHNKGVFVLRIEDTDKARSEKVYLDQILEDLKWLGLHWDEGPHFQSQRFPIYKKYAQKLLDEKKAYSEGTAIILRVPQKPFRFDDIIRGPIEFAAGSFKDQVLMKSDGTPTYNFACVIDDHDMKITHIIRGEDHISNTPKQMAIYEALGFSLPRFAHIPLIVAADRSRLSKRKGAMPVSYYREQGYLPEALFNFLALLGWSLGARQEIASKEEIIREFTLERVLKTAAAFNPEKLEWMNGQYIQQLDTKRLTELIAPFLIQKKYINKDYDKKKLTEIVELFKIRVKKLSDFPELADFFFVDKIEFAPEAKTFLQKKKNTKDIFTKLIAVLEKIDSFDIKTVEDSCRDLIAKEGIKSGDLIHPVRVALTGKRVGPGLFETMAALGRERVSARLTQALKLL